MNWLSLGNWVPHLHVHLVPRDLDDPAAGEPIESDAFALAPQRPVPEDHLRSEAAALRELIGRRVAGPKP
jgi:diadenosine tetraphosphate (Ap4A) HIT family hydrolase